MAASRSIVPKSFRMLADGLARCLAGVEMVVGGSERPALRKRYVRNRGKRYRVAAKLDPVKVAWIVREMEKGDRGSAEIASCMGVSARRVQQIHAEYRRTGAVPALAMPGRPRAEIHDHVKMEVERAFRLHRTGAVRLERILDATARIHIPHNTIHRIMREKGLASKQPKKSARRKWVRYERTYSNSMWHTDYKLLDDGRWFIAYQDDASRFIVGYGVFEEATGKHAVEVLKDSISRHGKPASVLTDRGSQFYANEKEAAARGEAMFEKELVALDIRRILARAGHPQTNGKLERFHGEIQRKLKWFSGIDELVRWYNYDRPHDSLDREALETPARAFVRKMPRSGETVKDGATGEVYHAR